MSEQYGKLTDLGKEILHRFAKSKKELHQHRFQAFSRSPEGGSYEWGIHSIRQMWKGLPVSVAMLDCLQAFLRKQDSKYQNEKIYVLTNEMKEPVAGNKPWAPLRAWDNALSWVHEKLGLAPAAICKSKDEIQWAAEQILEDVGRRLGVADGELETNASAAEAIAVGERKMARTLADYVEHLYSLWLVQPDCLRFAVHNRRRVGISAIYSVNEEAFQGLRGGQLFEMNIEPRDMQARSNLFYIHLAIELQQPRITRKQAEKASLICVVSQLATLAKELAHLAKFDSDAQMKYVGIGACKEAAEKYRSAGFVPVKDARMPVVDKELFELTADIHRSSSDGSMYDKMRLGIGFFQAGHKLVARYGYC